MQTKLGAISNGIALPEDVREALGGASYSPAENHVIRCANVIQQTSNLDVNAAFAQMRASASFSNLARSGIVVAAGEWRLPNAMQVWTRKWPLKVRLAETLQAFYESTTHYDSYVSAIPIVDVELFTINATTLDAQVAGAINITPVQASTGLQLKSSHEVASQSTTVFVQGAISGASIREASVRVALPSPQQVAAELLARLRAEAQLPGPVMTWGSANTLTLAVRYDGGAQVGPELCDGRWSARATGNAGQKAFSFGPTINRAEQAGDECRLELTFTDFTDRALKDATLNMKIQLERPASNAAMAISVIVAPFDMFIANRWRAILDIPVCEVHQNQDQKSEVRCSAQATIEGPSPAQVKGLRIQSLECGADTPSTTGEKLQREGQSAKASYRATWVFPLTSTRACLMSSGAQYSDSDSDLVPFNRSAFFF